MRRFAFAAIIATALAGPAFAQQMSAQDFVNMAASSDMFEIQSSQRALEQAQVQGVKDFAQMMIKDHTASSDKLKTIAAAQNLTVPAEMMPPQTEMMQRVTGAQGEAFDAAYDQAQTENHMAAEKLMQSYSQNGDNAALKAFAAETLPVVQKHLEIAKTLPGGDKAMTMTTQ